MSKFLVTVQGKLMIEAQDKDLAKEQAKGILAARQPWLSLAYGDPERIGETTEVSSDTLVQ